MTLMGYYLSPQNKSILDLFIPDIKSQNKDFSIQIKNPKKLEKIIRNSQGYDEYKWIGKKFIISCKDDKIDFKLRQFELSYLISHEELTDNTEMDFFQLMNKLLSHPSEEIIYSNLTLTDSEVDMVRKWAIVNGYTTDFGPNSLKLSKNAA